MNPFHLSASLFKFQCVTYVLFQPPPAPKAETKWEKFAKVKGIGQNKDKRSAKVWDETIGDWQYRHGYKKAGNDGKEWPIMEVKEGDDDEDEDDGVYPPRRGGKRDGRVES